MQNDDELIDSYIAGDEEAFAEIVKRYLTYVYSFAVRLTGNKNEAEDITQDTFLKVWKNIKKYSNQRANFKTWLTHITRNTTIDYMRKHKPALFSDFEDDDGENNFADMLSDESPLQDEIASQLAEKKKLEDAIATLSPLYREVVLLYYGSGLSLEEISTALGTSVNTVKSRYRRAVAQLKKMFGGDKK